MPNTILPDVKDSLTAAGYDMNRIVLERYIPVKSDLNGTCEWQGVMVSEEKYKLLLADNMFDLERQRVDLLKKQNDLLGELGESLANLKLGNAPVLIQCNSKDAQFLAVPLSQVLLIKSGTDGNGSRTLTLTIPGRDIVVKDPDRIDSILFALQGGRNVSIIG